MSKRKEDQLFAKLYFTKFDDKEKEASHYHSLVRKIKDLEKYVSTKLSNCTENTEAKTVCDILSKVNSSFKKELMNDSLVELAIKDWTFTPGPRYKSEGKHSGEEYREQLVPLLEKACYLTINLDGVAGYGTAFLEEVFGGLCRVNKFPGDFLENHISLISIEEPYLIEDIKGYIKKAWGR